MMGDRMRDDPVRQYAFDAVDDHTNPGVAQDLNAVLTSPPCGVTTQVDSADQEQLRPVLHDFAVAYLREVSLGRP